MFGGTCWIDRDRSSKFGNRGIVFVLGHQCARQTSMAATPTRVGLIKLAQFGDGRVIVCFVAEGSAEIAADRGLFWCDALGLTIFGDGIVKPSLVMQDNAQVGV